MGVNYGGAIVMGNSGDSAMDGGMVARLQWAMAVVTRGDVTTSRVKQEGGTMRDKVQPADTLRGAVGMMCDATNSRGN